MIIIGICDDEIQMRKNLRSPLERKLQLMGLDYEIREFDSGEALMTRPNTDHLDILFLDIEMKELNGMETAKALRKREYDTVLIFVTAYPDFVFQGYEVHAFHYILKPYKESKIMEVLEQAVKEAGIQKDAFYTVEQKSGTTKIPLKKVIAFSSDRRKISVLMDDGEIDFYGKLGEVEKELPDTFLRIHNRYLVNLNRITAVDKEGCLCREHRFPVSRTYRQTLEVAFARLLLH